MTAANIKRSLQWVPTAIVLAIVLLAGTRLTVLSVNQHAEERRAAAQVAVESSAKALEAQLAAAAARISPNRTTRVASILANSKLLSQLGAAGYDFEVAHVEPGTRSRQVLQSSQNQPLRKPATRMMRLPARFAEGAANHTLELAIRPKTGWYPARELATAIGLLAVVAWLLGFGTHDLTHSLERSRAAQEYLKRRLRMLNERLTNEIDARQQLQQSFEHARYHDAFTGLPNRRYFMDRLDRALREVRTRQRQRIAIILVEMDRFKLVNDTLGHTAGDELMVQAARRFEKATAALECVLARWGGDQFAVLVLDVPASDTAFAIADALQESLREPFELRKHRLSIAARMGVTSVESGLQRAEDALREADIALSVAKRQEGVKAVAYIPAMGGDAASLVSLEADLHVALERSEFRLLFQPIVNLRAERIIGAEALLRWRHPIEGVLAPDKFLSIAEEAGLLVPVTRWIVLKVCRLAAEWRRRLPDDVPFYFSINLSASVLRDAGFADYVAEVLRETGIAPQALKFELTEGGLISNVGAARELLERLHGMGLELMLDDFGTGYSSLSYLQLFPFDYLKLDRPFVNRTRSNETNIGITSAVLQMASSLGLKAIAEVVETPDAAHALAEMGCEFGQGYFFCEPVEAEDALQRLRAQDFRLPAGPSPDEDQSPTLALPADWIAEGENEEPALAERAKRPQRTG
jgi:diguanylate cyclase (GGDEF)-like protein